jgi:HK97 family phage prohead protease
LKRQGLQKRNPKLKKSSLHLLKEIKMQQKRQTETKRLVMKFDPASDAEKKMLGEKQEGYIAGWASTSALDCYDDVVAPGAFAESINLRGTKGPKGVKLLLNHDSEDPAGVIEVLEYRDSKLWIEAQLALGASYVRDFYEVAKMNGGFNFSVGFRIQEYSIKKDDDGDDQRIITKGDLIEVSAVPFPANDECVMTDIKSTRKFTQAPSEIEKGFVASGLVKDRKNAGKAFKIVKGFVEEANKLVTLGLVNNVSDALAVIHEVMSKSVSVSGGGVDHVSTPTVTHSPLLAKMQKESIQERMEKLKEIFRS